MIENVKPNLFNRRDPAWVRVSRKYAIVDLIGNLIFTMVFLGAFAVLFTTTESASLYVSAAALAALSLINAVLAFRRVRAMGYILREDDLVFRRGIMFERIVSVPYGRLQLVDINRGPLLRMLGLATLKFVTASQATGVQLPGLSLADAEQLREKLIELAETRRSGL